MFEIGDTLREARIRRGLSIKDVEDGTKIRAKYLQALEEEDFEVIPGPTFVKGFMRTYAEYLELDGDRLVEEYRSRFDSQPDPHQIRPLDRRGRQRSSAPRRQPNHVLVALVALVVIVVLIYVGWGRGAAPAELDADAVGLGTETTAAESTGAGSTATTLSAPATASSVPAGEGSSAGAEATTTTTTAGSTTTTAATGPLEVVARAGEGRCWLLVRADSADGEVLYTGTLEPGQEERFSSDGTLWMHVGSPAMLDLTVNGQAVEVPEPYGQFLVTPAGVERIS